MDVISGKLLSPLEPLQLNQEIEAHDFSPELPDQTDRRLSRPPRRQEIVDDQDPFPRTDRISMDGQGIRSVLKAVFHFEAVRWQLTRFADRDEPGAEPACQHASEDESSRLDAHDFINPAVLIARGEFIGETAKCRRVFEQRGDIVKEDAGLGEIRHFADESLIVDTDLRG